MNQEEKSIAVYLSHDASICINPSPGVYRIYELERYLKERYCRINNHPKFLMTFLEIADLIKKEYGELNFTKCYAVKAGRSITETEKNVIQVAFGVKEFIEVGHHMAHAATALYQSDLEQCIIASIDGGGWDEDITVSTFNVFVADRKKGKIERLERFNIDLGNAYSIMAVPISEVRKGNFLSYAGKIMGLAAYGVVQNDWLPAMRHFYTVQFYGQNADGSENLTQLIALGNQIGLDLSRPDCVSGQVGYDLAATSQFVFEEMLLERLMPFIKHYELPVCVTGGCALNVLFNDRLKREIQYPVFVAPNPNDCGLSLGGMLLNEPSSSAIEATYSGFGILDIDKLDTFLSSEKFEVKKVTTSEIASIINEGKIIGVIKGNSECGPRALGNRSIICDPSIADMKDILNAKVKFREWYRPFAPIVRLEDVNKYFEFEGESRWMSFAPVTRSEWKDKLKSIVHEDGTSRVQTITKQQNEFIYELITEFEKLKGVGVILNTSFNIKGKPILTTIEDALNVLETTELDYVLVNEYLFKNKI